MLEVGDTVFVLVDVQGRLAQTMVNRERLFDNLQRLVKGLRVLGVPILWLEQNPRGLGPTIPELAALLPDVQPIPKVSFSCCRCEAFMKALRTTGRRQVLLAGIEAHVCIYQTAVDLLTQGYHVEVVADAVSSRTAENREIALMRLRDAGIPLTSVEMALFELLKVAQGPAFKEILAIVK
ncbi:MAG: hydrolase [Chloroflexi bacterium]|nr:hydrolase [Chloroflexota bacterium]